VLRCTNTEPSQRTNPPARREGRDRVSKNKSKSKGNAIIVLIIEQRIPTACELTCVIVCSSAGYLCELTACCIICVVIFYMREWATEHHHYHHHCFHHIHHKDCQHNQHCQHRCLSPSALRSGVGVLGLSIQENTTQVPPTHPPTSPGY
jgi:hypothetical protein